MDAAQLITQLKLVLAQELAGVTATVNEIKVDIAKWEGVMVTRADLEAMRGRVDTVEKDLTGKLSDAVKQVTDLRQETSTKHTELDTRMKMWAGAIGLVSGITSSVIAKIIFDAISNSGG